MKQNILKKSLEIISGMAIFVAVLYLVVFGKSIFLNKKTNTNITKNETKYVPNIMYDFVNDSTHTMQREEEVDEGPNSNKVLNKTECKISAYKANIVDHEAYGAFITALEYYAYEELDEVSAKCFNYSQIKDAIMKNVEYNANRCWFEENTQKALKEAEDRLTNKENEYYNEVKEIVLENWKENNCNLSEKDYN